LVNERFLFGTMKRGEVGPRPRFIVESAQL